MKLYNVEQIGYIRSRIGELSLTDKIEVNDVSSVIGWTRSSINKKNIFFTICVFHKFLTTTSL